MINEITKEQFQDYEEVRKSGLTNMFAVNTVSQLSGLDVPTIKNIMKQYGELSLQYPDVIGDQE